VENIKKMKATELDGAKWSVLCRNVPPKEGNCKRACVYVSV